MVETSALEKRQVARPRGFESHPLRLRHAEAWLRRDAVRSWPCEGGIRRRIITNMHYVYILECADGKSYTGALMI